MRSCEDCEEDDMARPADERAHNVEECERAEMVEIW